MITLPELETKPLVFPKTCFANLLMRKFTKIILALVGHEHEHDPVVPSVLVFMPFRASANKVI